MKFYYNFLFLKNKDYKEDHEMIEGNHDYVEYNNSNDIFNRIVDHVIEEFKFTNGNENAYSSIDIDQSKDRVTSIKTIRFFINRDVYLNDIINKGDTLESLLMIKDEDLTFFNEIYKKNIEMYRKFLEKNKKKSPTLFESNTDTDSSNKTNEDSTSTSTPTVIIYLEKNKYTYTNVLDKSQEKDDILLTEEKLFTPIFELTGNYSISSDSLNLPLSSLPTFRKKSTSLIRGQYHRSFYIPIVIKENLKTHVNENYYQQSKNSSVFTILYIKIDRFERSNLMEKISILSNDRSVTLSDFYCYTEYNKKQYYFEKLENKNELIQFRLPKNYITK